MSVNRRYFLLGPAAAAKVWGQSANNTVATAVIGTGNRGSHLLRGVLEQPDAKVVALCDIKPDRLDKAATAAARDNPATYSEWRRVIDRQDVQAVFIATPPDLHAPMAIAALEAGKHVYCEKPIGITATQVRDVVRAARRSKAVFVAGQQLRSTGMLAEAVQKIREGIIGEILMVKAQRQASGDINHQGPSADWYFDVKRSGGYLIEQSVHNIDVCNWAIGAHPLRACGFGGILLYKNDPPGRTIFDCGSITYEYPGGVKMSFTQHVFQARGFPVREQYVHVFGSKGTVDLFGGIPIMYAFGPGRSAPVPLAEKRQENEHQHLVAFYECITKGGKPPADVIVGAEAALTAILGHEAMVRERVVNWSDLGAGV